MEILFVIEDEQHAELCGEFLSYNLALKELEYRATKSWEESPNQCPCSNWEKCRRCYEIVEYETSQFPWKELRRIPIFTISADGVLWDKDSLNKDI